jgi:hypothetical protein
MLGRLKYSFQDLRKAVLSIDSEILTEQTIRQFLQFVPTAEEVGALAKYKDSSVNLAKAESFMIEMMKVSRYEQRLRAFLFMTTFAERFQGLVQNVDSIINSIRSIRNTPKRESTRQQTGFESPETALSAASTFAVSVAARTAGSREG